MTPTGSIMHFIDVALKTKMQLVHFKSNSFNGLAVISTVDSKKVIKQVLSNNNCYEVQQENVNNYVLTHSIYPCSDEQLKAIVDNQFDLTLLQRINTTN